MKLGFHQNVMRNYVPTSQYTPCVSITFTIQILTRRAHYSPLSLHLAAFHFIERVRKVAVYLNADRRQVITTEHNTQVVSCLRCECCGAESHHTLPVLLGITLVCNHCGSSNCTGTFQRPCIAYKAGTGQLNIVRVNETFQTGVINILLTY
jgi:hypothetical protein